MKVVFRSEGMPLDPLLEAARLAEQAGGHALLTAENRFDPFLPLVLAAEHTTRIKIGPSVAIAFPRSPFMTAQLGWELQRYSNGRFELGLGTQVRGHIRRRFGASWEPPVRRMREYIGAVRSIWHSFQTGERLNVAGEFYSLNLLTPQFNPGPIDHPDIPVLVAGANRGMCRLAGSACEGLLLHPLASPEYVRQVAWPAVEEGAQSADRSLDAFELSSSGFVAAGDTDAEVGERWEAIRERIAFYASTPAYQTILKVHGWEDLTPALHARSREGKWKEMAGLISDEVVAAFTVSGRYEEIGAKLRQRWDGVASRVEVALTAIERATPEQVARIVADVTGD